MVLKMNTRRQFMIAGLSLAAAGLARPVAAAGYPDRTVRIVVPFPPGGATDSLGRLVAQGLAEKLGQPFVVENRAGAAGVIGAGQVSRSAPDGYTLLMAATGAIVPGPGQDAASYRVADHYAPVSLVAAPPYILVVNPKVPAASAAQLVELAKRDGAGLSYASSGVGSASHLAGLQLERRAGVQLLHIPYKGMGQAVTDVMSGQVAMMFAPAPAVLAHIAAGNLRALAVTSRERSPLFPMYPTLAEAGVAGYESVGWFGLLAPPATPPAVVATLHQSVAELLRSPTATEQLKAMGATPARSTPAEFTAFLDQDTKQLTELLKDVKQ
ncbi:hypothetical protein CAL12_23430 [Bordetella genomosp. 8]|uniref:ABC transporter substrate-binding protein n=2 Tax=Bordetella genomosp. 8 TaxID=1416806 RepID=A0A1W6YRD3_9BORD|nr:hypothetical protein CAL12_23430 [Bordetella genomosp. 8]